jgi:hypothetical protein
VAPRRSCVNRRYGGTNRLHLQGRKIRKRGTSVSRWLQTEPPVENTELYKNRMGGRGLHGKSLRGESVAVCRDRRAGSIERVRASIGSLSGGRNQGYRANINAVASGLSCRVFIDPVAFKMWRHVQEFSWVSRWEASMTCGDKNPPFCLYCLDGGHWDWVPGKQNEQRCRQQSPAHAGSSLANFSTPKMEAISSSETSVHTKSTRRHIPEYGILHTRRRENLRS